jgi:hypothetical protein
MAYCIKYMQIIRYTNYMSLMFIYYMMQEQILCHFVK